MRRSIPSPSLSKRLKASLNSAIWSSLSWSAMAMKLREDEGSRSRECYEQALMATARAGGVCSCARRGGDDELMMLQAASWGFIR